MDFLIRGKVVLGEKCHPTRDIRLAKLRKARKKKEQRLQNCAPCHLVSIEAIKERSRAQIIFRQDQRILGFTADATCPITHDSLEGTHTVASVKFCDETRVLFYRFLLRSCFPEFRPIVNAAVP